MTREELDAKTPKACRDIGWTCGACVKHGIECDLIVAARTLERVREWVEKWDEPEQRQEYVMMGPFALARMVNELRAILAGTEE